MCYAIQNVSLSDLGFYMIILYHKVVFQLFTSEILQYVQMIHYMKSAVYL